MREVSPHESICLRDEKERLMGEVRHCDFCSTSMAEHSRCHEETAKTSGRRSKACLN